MKRFSKFGTLGVAVVASLCLVGIMNPDTAFGEPAGANNSTEAREIATAQHDLMVLEARSGDFLESADNTGEDHLVFLVIAVPMEKRPTLGNKPYAVMTAPTSEGVMTANIWRGTANGFKVQVIKPGNPKYPDTATRFAKQVSASFLDTGSIGGP